MLAAARWATQLLPFGQVYAHRASCRRQGDDSRRVGNLQIGLAGLRTTRRCRLAVRQQRAARGAVGLCCGIQFLGDLRAQQHFAAEQLAKLSDFGLQSVALGLQLDSGELRQSPKSKLEDVLSLCLGKVEHRPQSRARLLGVVG